MSKKSKIGRPPLPEGSKKVLIAAKVHPDIDKYIKAKAGTPGYKDKTAVMETAFSLMMEMEPLSK